MRQELSKKQLIELQKFCPNLQIGGGCWAKCPYRENGFCELDIHYVLQTALSYLEQEIDKPDNLTSDSDVFLNKTVREFFKEQPCVTVELLTPCGHVALHGRQINQIMNGSKLVASPGVTEMNVIIDAKEILNQKIKSVNYDNGVWYLLTTQNEEGEN